MATVDTCFNVYWQTPSACCTTTCIYVLCLIARDVLPPHTEKLSICLPSGPVSVQSVPRYPVGSGSTPITDVSIPPPCCADSTWASHVAQARSVNCWNAPSVCCQRITLKYNGNQQNSKEAFRPSFQRKRPKRISNLGHPSRKPNVQDPLPLLRWA